MEAVYLLRFDDICPSMNWRVWDHVESTLLDNQLRPILAVIPDNRDDALRVSAPDGRFWDRVRGWQARGWTIAMHGWQHRFVTKDAGILRVNRYSEFAGLSRHEQEMKIRAGLEVFEREGIRSKIWVAPAHSFDHVTLQILRDLDFRYISDGFFPLPHVDRFGITWVPQQLWSFRRRPFGVWTICFHINRWASRETLDFKESVKKYCQKISEFSVVASQYDGRQECIFDSAAARLYRSAALVMTAAKQLATCFR